MKRFRIRYYYEMMQEDIIEAASQDEAVEKATRLVEDWDLNTPVPEFVGGEELFVNELKD